MYWKRASVRRVLLGALMVLGGWGFFSSLYQVSQSWKEYERSRDMADWAYAAGQIVTMAQHLAFERGRTAVVLKGVNPIAEADGAFIDDRRVLSDRAVAALRLRLERLPDVGQAAFFENWQGVLDMRQQVDRDKVLPLAQRDPTLAPRWLKHATAMLEQGSKLTNELVRHYRQGEDESRLLLLSFLALKLRLNAGSEASLIAQQVASNIPMEREDIHARIKGYGQQEAIWAEIERTVDYLANPDMKQVVAGILQQRSILRSMQENILNAWINKRPVTVAVEDITATSQPLLDGISELIAYAVKEEMRVASERKKSVRVTLVTHIALAISVLLVLLLAVYYVLARVVRPLERVDERLRRINFQTFSKEAIHENQIERLKEMAQILEGVFAEKAQLENELRDLAYYDALTGMPNRRLLQDRLHQSILRATREKSLVALLFIDLDEFKAINDGFGHETGDWILQAVAERIVFCIRASDTASRLGGNEFVVLLTGLAQSEDARAVAEKIRAALEQPFVAPDGRHLEISCSIGVAIYPHHADNALDLLRVGDEAMFRAKGAGRNKVEMIR